MTVGRKPIEFVPQDKPVVDAEKANNDLAAAELLGKAIQGYGQGRDLVNQLLGQAQMAGAFEQFSRTVSVSKLAIVKENKLYQQLAGMRTPNGSELKGTWAEFCSHLGMSEDKADLDIKNLQAFGEEALENMQRVGIGYRDLRQFRKLPTDQRTALIEAAKEGDKGTLLELAEDLIAKHQREKESAAKTLEDTEASLVAARRVVGEKETTISGLQEKLAVAEGKSKLALTASGDDAENAGKDLIVETLAELDEQVREITNLIFSPLYAALRKLSAPELEMGDIVRQQAMNGAMGRVLAAARQVAQDFDVPVSGVDAADGCGEMDAIWAATLRDMPAAEGESHVAED